ncbi:hypothetical protein MKD33_17370, partial [Chromobacterium piscinae]
TPLAAL